MTQEEAEARSRELTETHPDRERVRWVAREGGDGWEVVRIPLPEGMTLRPLKPGVEAKPRPPQADDPRPAHIRNAPGGWG